MTRAAGLSRVVGIQKQNLFSIAELLGDPIEVKWSSFDKFNVRSARYLPELLDEKAAG
jgi:hypothetical protein